MTDFCERRRMPGPEAFAHGTRARYVTGCRCADCRASNVRRYHERQELGKAAARALPPAPAMPLKRVWIGSDGKARARVFKRACPGAHRRGCPDRSYLRKDSKGGVCRGCRARLIWNGCVDTAPVRAHLRRLSRQGVGRRAVADAADVGETTVWFIYTGRKKQCRKTTADRILAVSRDHISDHALVPAGAAWRRLNLLLEEGFSKAELARRMGKRSLQLKKTRITALNASKVERLYRRVMEVPA